MSDLTMHCPYCGGEVPINPDRISRVEATAGVGELTTFTVTFLTHHVRCTRNPEAGEKP